MSDLAVAIVFFNKAEQSIEGIRCFARAGVPVYVLNNGSASNAASLVRAECERLPNVRYFHSDNNLGPAGGRNFLIRHSNEPWILFADNDITVREPHWLGNIRTHISHSRDVDLFIPVIHNIWDGSRVRPAYLTIENGEAIFSNTSTEYTNIFPGGASIISRSMFDRVGLYDEDLWAFEEWELCIRAMNQGKPVCARHIQDINFLHDHRLVQSTDDKNAVLVRYDSDKIGRAHDKVERLHGVKLDRNYDTWLKQQIVEMTDPNWKAPLNRGPTLADRLVSGRRRLRRAMASIKGKFRLD